MEKNELPESRVRQLGPDIWTFNGYDPKEGADVGTEWNLVADGVGSGTLITRIAGAKMEAFDFTPSIPYPDEPHNLPSVEETAWHTLKSKPEVIENVTCVNLYQLVGRYYKRDEIEYQKGVDDGRYTPIPELGLIKREE
jgi:hypothetical protein